jgi:hypothetical protein
MLPDIDEPAPVKHLDRVEEIDDSMLNVTDVNFVNPTVIQGKCCSESNIATYLNSLV